MRCYDCGGTYIEHFGSLSLHDDYIGNYKVSDVQYFKCENCNQLLFPKDTAIKIESVENDIKYKLIGQLPVRDFVSANAAAGLLGISKQAFNKNRRIRNGFIYSVSLEGKKLYNKKSLLLFNKKGDGRFNLSEQIDSSVIDSETGMSQIVVEKEQTSALSIMSTTDDHISISTPNREKIDSPVECWSEFGILEWIFKDIDMTVPNPVYTPNKIMEKI
jgi:hypothetical protein